MATAKDSPRKRISVEFPEELVKECLARVPLSSQKAMTLISKKIQKFINRGEIFQLRSSHNIKETSILVGLKSDEDGLTWYTLVKRLRKQEYLLTPVTFPPVSGKETFFAVGDKVVVLGASDFFYVEGGSYTKKKDLSKCKVMHHDPIIEVIDGKVYFFGGCSNEDALNYLEFLDVSTNKWETIPIPEQDRALIPPNPARVVWNGVVHFIRGAECVIFDPKTRKLERKDHASMGERMYLTSCVINNTIYTVGWNNKIEFFDSNSRTWRAVRGVEPLPEFEFFSTALFNFNGKLMVLHRQRQEEIWHKQRQEEIWFTLIALEKQGLEMLGRVESCNCGLTLEKPAMIQQLVSVEV